MTQYQNAPVHPVPAGKTGLGILFLVFCWTGIPVVIAVIQAIIAAFKPSDAYGCIVI